MVTPSRAPTTRQSTNAVMATPLICTTPILVMTLPPARWLWNQFVQLIDQIFDCEAGGPSPSHTFSYDLGQLPLAFSFPASELLRADKSSGSLMGFKQSAE